jgi:DNA polymerase-1
VDIYNELRLRGLKSRILGTVHDSIEVESPSDELEEVLQIIHRKMVFTPKLKSAGYSLKVPIEIDVEIGDSFSGNNKVEFDSHSSILNREVLAA